MKYLGTLACTSSSGLLPTRGELREYQATAGRQVGLAPATLRRADPQVVESEGIQGARVAARNAAGDCDLLGEEVPVHRTG